MSKHSLRLSQLTLAVLSSLAAVTAVLPVVVSNMRRHPPDVSITRLQGPVTTRLAGAVTRNQASLKTICFVRGAWIYLANSSSGREAKLVEGASPHLAPTGEYLAFVSVTENEGNLNRAFPSPNRLRIMNLRTKEVSDFSVFRNRRTGAPIWSNDGARIAVVTSDSDSGPPYIAILNPVTRLVEKKITAGWDHLTPDEGLYIDSWTPKDESLLFHTLRALYEARLEDLTVQRLAIDEVFRSGGISSATQFSFSPDRRYLLFDQIIDSPEEPETAVVLIYDLTTKSLRRVTPKFLQGRDPVWLPSGNEFLFTRVQWVKGRWRPSIYKMKTNGSGLTTILQDADYVSYSVR